MDRVFAVRPGAPLPKRVILVDDIWTSGATFEAAAATLGINPAIVKLGAFGVSAAYAGVAGSLSVLVLGNAEANKATTFNQSILFLIAVVVGGTATALGGSPISASVTLSTKSRALFGVAPAASFVMPFGSFETHNDWLGIFSNRPKGMPR